MATLGVLITTPEFWMYSQMIFSKFYNIHTFLFWSSVLKLKSNDFENLLQSALGFSVTSAVNMTHNAESPCQLSHRISCQKYDFVN